MEAGVSRQWSLCPYSSPWTEKQLCPLLPSLGERSGEIDGQPEPVGKRKAFLLPSAALFSSLKGKMAEERGNPGTSLTHCV